MAGKVIWHGGKDNWLLYQPYLEDSSITQQLVEQFAKDIFSVPWGHHVLLIEES